MSDPDLRIEVIGDECSGKSTVLVICADYLASLGYTVVVPRHLRGLHINLDVLTEPRRNKTIVFSEILEPQQ